MKKIIVSLATALMAVLLTPVSAQARPVAMTHDPCNTTSWTWPLCEIGTPSIPRFNVQGPRPALTPKNSPWCWKQYLQIDQEGYVFWKKTHTVKYDLVWWPDYYAHTWRAMYWNTQAQTFYWVQPYQGLRVFCDA